LGAQEEGEIEMTQLAHRRNHDFDVALYWDTNRDELFVVVEDIGAGDRFSIAAPRARALDVFEHPFAYAASR
jgi:hypothetical protein